MTIFPSTWQYFPQYRNIPQVECKKAQPKEVMLPANLAKGRAAAAARGLGEFLLVTSGGAQCQPVMRYSPYTLPSSSLSPSSSPSNTSTFHQAILQANMQQLQQLVGGSSSPPDLGGMFSCKAAGPPGGNFYNIQDLLSLPSPYQVPVGL